MAPTWPANSNKDRLKIDAKIDQTFDVSWDRFLEGFGRILEAKMEPCWHQNRLRIDATCEKRIFEKSLILFWKNHNVEGSGSKLGAKFD